MEAINITAYPSDAAQIKAIKAVMKALKIKFEINKEKVSGESPYNPEFVAKIKKSQQDYKEEKYTTVKMSDLDTFLGIK